MDRRLFLPLLLAAGGACLAGASSAEDPIPDAAKTDHLTKNRIDLSVPDSPAFTALGVTPQEVIRPSSPKALGAGLLNGVDENGNFQTGLALDFAPYLLFFGDDVTLEQYDDSYPIRLLSRAQISGATTKGTSGDDESIRMGLGVRLTPWDVGDPRLDRTLMTCFHEEIGISSPEAGRLRDRIEDWTSDRVFLEAEIEEEQDEERKAELEAELAELQVDIDRGHADLQKMTDEKATACREKAIARNWNRSSWTLGAAPTWIAGDGSFGDLGWNTATFWTSLAYGFERVPVLQDASQFLLSVRYALGEEVPIGDDMLEERDALTVGAQLRIVAYRARAKNGEEGRERRPLLILGAEGDYVYADRDDAPNDSYYKLSVGADIKVPFLDNTYLKVSAGGSGGRKDGMDSGFVIANVKYGF